MTQPPGKRICVVSSRCTGAAIETIHHFLCMESMMAFEDILLSLTTYPESTKTTAIEDAVALAVALESKISALACEVRVSVPSSAA